jgi:probable F420-dependent oxidoreductase
MPDDATITAPKANAQTPWAGSRLGPVGVWTRLGLTSAGNARRVAAEIEQLGYGSIWFGESPTHKEAFGHASLLLNATSDVVVGTGIASIWARDAIAMANGAATLGEAFPARFLLGVGVSHAPQVSSRGHHYERPLTRMAGYLGEMDAATYLAPPPQPRVPRVIAALGPRMLELARDKADGAHPYLVTPRHSARARAVLGPGKLLIPEQKIVLEHDKDRARAIARKHLAFYLTVRNYMRSLNNLGFTDDEFADGGSDRLVDALVAWGNPAAIRERVQQHLDAGADTVLVQVLSDDGDAGVAQLTELAPELLSR